MYRWSLIKPLAEIIKHQDLLGGPISCSWWWIPIHSGPLPGSNCPTLWQILDRHSKKDFYSTNWATLMVTHVESHQLYHMIKNLLESTRYLWIQLQLKSRDSSLLGFYFCSEIPALVCCSALIMHHFSLSRNSCYKPTLLPKPSILPKPASILLQPPLLT